MTEEFQSKRPSSRREFLVTAAALWQAAVLRAQQHHHSVLPAQSTAPYEFSFLNQEQQNSIRRLMSHIVPADERSTGALGAKVDEYLDFILFHADPVIQNTWKRGLQTYSAAISGGSEASVEAFLEKQAAHEFAPKNDDETFFVILKAAVTEGFYTSEVGINQELGYKGMSFLIDFPGCTHSSHHAPDNWHPVLQQAKDS